MREELHHPYGNPFPAETAIFALEGTTAALEVTRTLFHTAHDYTESFSVYGNKRSFEWQQIEDEQPVLHTMDALQPGRGRPIAVERVAVPDRAGMLPAEIARFTTCGVYSAAEPHRSFVQGGGHGGSHPHLVHEFIRAIVEERRPAVDAVTAANWTAPGICAHQSAMAGAAGVDVPLFAP
jgi:predicted dehydrogenase